MWAARRLACVVLGLALVAGFSPPSAGMAAKDRQGVVSEMKQMSKPLNLAKKLINPNEKYKPKRVALLVEPTPFTHVSGYANRFKEMLRHLRDMKVEVGVATPDDKPDAPSEYMGHKIVTVEGFRFPLYAHLCLTLDLNRRAKQMIDVFKPDLIHASSPGFFVLAAIAYAKAVDVPLVLSYHTHLPVYAERYASWLPFARQTSWAAIKLAHSHADLTLVTSPQMKDEFAEQNIKRVEVWRKGVDVDVFNPRHRDAETRADVLLAPGTERPEGKTVMLYVGRLSVEKRLDELAETLDATSDDVRLALVGGGPAEEALRRHFARFGDRVVFCGVLRGEALSQAYASADIFCMPSDSETLGFVVIEAMASGLAVVAARAGGIPDIVADDSNGLLVTPLDPGDFAAKIRRVLEDPDLSARLKTQGRRDAESWGWRAATDELRDVWYAQATHRHDVLKKKSGEKKGLRLFPLTTRAFSMRLAAVCRSIRVRLGLGAIGRLFAKLSASSSPNDDANTTNTNTNTNRAHNAKGRDRPLVARA